MANRILYVQTAFVGDLLLAIPTLRTLRLKNPNSQITLLCRKGLGDFLRLSKVVDEIIEADKSSTQHWQEVENNLVQIVWDEVYCPHQSIRSLKLVKKLKSAKKIGYRSWLGKFVFDEAIERPMHLPEALRQLVLLRSMRTAEILSFETVNNKNLRSRMPRNKESKKSDIVERLKAVPEWASMEIPELKASKEKLVVLAPGSVWQTKRWTEEGFSNLAAHFVRQGMRVELVGAPDEREVCERVRASALKILADNSESPKIINSAGQLSLWQSAQQMGKAQLVVANDSGAMHMAACAGTPSVSVFGPTVLEQGYRPWQSNSLVLHKVLSCRPCGKHGARKCPIGTHECMKLVPATSVIEAAQSLL